MKTAHSPFPIKVLGFAALTAAFYLFHYQGEETFLDRMVPPFLIRFEGQVKKGGFLLLEEGGRGISSEIMGKQGPLSFFLSRFPSGSGTFTLLENHDFHHPFTFFPKWQMVEREKKGKAFGLIKIDGLSGATLTGKLIEGNLTRLWSRLEREAFEKDGKKEKNEKR